MMKVAIVGCGNIARAHAKNLKGRAEIVFVSRNPESARKLQRKFGVGTVASFEDVIQDRDVKGVVVCSPPSAHVEQVSALLAAGKRVLVEKPVCVDEAEMRVLDAIVSTRPKGQLMVGENYYYKPSTRRLKEWLLENGNLRQISIRKCLIEATPGWKAELGALLEGGIHFVALMTEVAGRKALGVNATFPGYVMGRPERHSKLQIEFEGGGRGALEYSLVTPSLTKGIFQHSSIETDRKKLIFESNGLYAMEGKRILPFPVRDLLGFGALMDDFLKGLSTPSHVPYASWERIKSDYEIIWKAYSSLKPTR